MNSFDWEYDSVSKKDVYVREEECCIPEHDVNDRLDMVTSLASHLEDLTSQKGDFGRKKDKEILQYGLMDELSGIKPNVSLVGSTRAEREALVEELRKAVGDIVYRRRMRFLNAWKEESVKFAKLQRLTESLPDEQRVMRSGRGPLNPRGNSVVLADAALNFQDNFHEDKARVYDDFRIRTQEQFQARVNCLLDQASEEFYCPFSQHLAKKETARDALDRAHDALKAQDTCQTRGTVEGTRDIPWMIAKAILSEADLESCAQLRQVNRFWYSFFHESESLLEYKVRKRSPWMSPSGELKTWADCALVFAKRLASNRWTEIDDLHDFPMADLAPVRRFPVRELEWGQKLPANFRGLDARKNDSADISETRELLEVDMPDMHFSKKYFDLKNFRPVEVPTSKFDKMQDVRRRGKGLVIKYKNLKITLPYDKVADAALVDDIAINKHSVIVRCITPTHTYLYFVFPIHQLHYKNATILRKSGQLYEIGTVVVHQRLKGNKSILYYYNVDTRRYERYGRYRSAPVASYNGLIWWKESDTKFRNGDLPIAPTFMDTNKQENQVYFRKDKMICMDTDNEYSCIGLKDSTFHQCSREPQFVFSDEGRSMMLLDLSAGSVTELKNVFKVGGGRDDDGRGTFVFTGFVGNTFYARCYPPDTVFHCGDKMRRWTEGAEVQVLPQAEKFFDYEL
ncbi:hypothetical protein CJU90_3159 [Yarrowia sp. C11]|nr:hypothetical protein CKK34_4608 [Yarrowia sp. E02]KAG5369669.1 hypothetical protein CJU90_3159 [Yarrowia sp. C11]